MSDLSAILADSLPERRITAANAARVVAAIERKGHRVTEIIHEADQVRLQVVDRATRLPFTASRIDDPRLLGSA